MKKFVLLVLCFYAANSVNAQHGYYGHHHHRYNERPFISARIGFGLPYCTPYYRRPGISVVIAPQPRVVVVEAPPQAQPRMIREWVEGHWEENSYGRTWVEGHYIQREVGY